MELAGRRIVIVNDAETRDIHSAVTECTQVVVVDTLQWRIGSSMTRTVIMTMKGNVSH